MKARLRMILTILLLGAAMAAFAVLQGCSSSTNFPASNPANPAPGVNLQAIKITPSTKLLGLASSRQLYATGIYNNGTQIDLTSQVTWAASSTTVPPSSTSAVSLSSSGVATGVALGPSAVTATLNGIVGLIQITVNTDGYTSNTIAILTVPYKNGEIDVMYQPHSLTQTQGVYTVEEVNLDSDQFTSQLPVPAAVLASIPMSSGYVPNATIANGADGLVAVISYTSPEVVIIDASNLPGDTANNTVINTFTAPVKGQVTFNETFNGIPNPITCIVCAAVVNPLNGQLLLSTAQGYYSMDFTTGEFTPLLFASTVFPAPGFSLNPVASPPYIISPTFGQDPQNPSEVQVANLPSSSGPGAVNTYTNLGLTQPNAAVVGLFPNQAGPNAGANDVEVVDAGADDEALISLVGTQVSSPYLVSPMSTCTGTAGPPFNMIALGTPPSSASILPSSIQSTPFFSQASGDCVGFEVWPSPSAGNPFAPQQSDVEYVYGPMPNTPDGNVFNNGGDPNAIATFTSVIDGNNYGVLVDANQNWIAKVALTGSKGILDVEESGTTSPPPPPVGQALATGPAGILIAGIASDPVVFLPAPDSVAILSLNTINFGSVSVGTTTPQSLVTLTNVGQNLLTINGVSITGTNVDQFAYTTTCFLTLNPASNCAIEVTFTPTSAQQFSATLEVSDNGGQSPQTVQLSGSGQ